MQPNQSNHTLSFVAKYELPHVNKNNLHTYSPYYFDYDKNCYIIDEKWYSNLIQNTQVELKEKFRTLEIREVQYPHLVNKAYQYWEIYTWYNCQMYDFGRYIQDVSKVNNQQIHLIKFQNTKQRAQFSQLFFKQNPKIQTMQRLNKQIQQILDKNNKKYFIKLTQRSGKNEIKLFAARTVEDVYRNLIYSDDVKKQIYQSSGILMRQWKQFQNGVEFRVIVYNRRVIGVSPQFYNKKIQWKTINFTKLIDLIQEGLKDIQFANSFVIDLMFVDNQTVWFLQFNPYGVYAASRSALFTHEEILQLEKQVGLPVIKIVQN